MSAHTEYPLPRSARLTEATIRQCPHGGGMAESSLTSYEF
jgi:hypothetical protein